MAKNILDPLEIAADIAEIDEGIQKKIHFSETTLLMISNKEMNDIMKVVQALEHSNFLLKGITKTIGNETKEQKRGLLGMLLGALGASLLGNLLTRKRILGATCENKKGKGI